MRIRKVEGLQVTFAMKGKEGLEDWRRRDSRVTST